MNLQMILDDIPNSSRHSLAPEGDDKIGCRDRDLHEVSHLQPIGKYSFGDVSDIMTCIEWSDDDLQLLNQYTGEFFPVFLDQEGSLGTIDGIAALGNVSYLEH